MNGASNWKSAWATLIISALTDGYLASYAALMAAISIDSASINRLTILAIVAGGVAAFMRAINQALKATAADTAALRGQEVQVTTVTPEGVVQSNPTPTAALSVGVNVNPGGPDAKP